MEDVTAIITAMTDAEQPFLRECLDSVISDPGIVQVIICVQDSNAWIDEMLATRPDPVTIVRMPFRSLGMVRNEGVKHVKTEWLAFCDGDDVWCKGKTRIQRAYAFKHGCDFVGSDHYLTDEAGRIRAFALAKYLPMPSSWMIRTSTMREHPFADTRWEDSEWWKRTREFVAKNRCPRLLLRYRVRAMSSSSTEPSKKRKVRAVALASIPMLGKGVLALTGCLWLLNRSHYYRPLLK